MGAYCPPIGNFMVAEKIPGVGLWKWIGFLDFFGTAGIASCMQNIMLRDEIREKDGIEGSLFDDCLTACLCLPCSVCQTYNHVKSHEMDGTEGSSLDDRLAGSCCLPCLPYLVCLSYNHEIPFISKKR